MLSRELALPLTWTAFMLIVAYACVRLIGEDKPLREPCAFGQRPYAELVEQKAAAGAVDLKIIVTCRENRN